MFKRSFLTLLTALAAVLGTLANKVVAWADKKIRHYDPLDNLGLFFSPWRLWFHKRGNTLMLAFGLVALAALPGAAMPVWRESGAISFFATHSLGLAAIGATAAKPDQRLPFRFGTVRRRINIGSFTLTPGTQLPAVVIPQVGMLSRVLFDIEGGYTGANAPLVVANLDGMDAIFARAQISLNNGSALICDLSGIGVNVLNQSISDSLPIKRGTAGVGNVQGLGFPLAIGAGTFAYKGFLPVNANQRRQFEMGLLNLQAPELRATINLTFNPLATLFTTAANATLFAATCNLSYEYFEIPDLSRYQMPPLTLVRSIEEAGAAIAATGLQVFQLPRLGTMIDYHAVLVLNLLYAPVLTNLTEFAVRYNKTNVQYDVFIGDWETYEAELYGDGAGGAVTPSAATGNPQTFMNPNAITFNLWAASAERTNGGDFRDAIDTEENTTTEILITVKTGTALNASKDNLFHVRRVVQRIIPAQRAA
jgi:hypothetical protein